MSFTLALSVVKHKGKRRNYNKFVAIPFQSTITLGTLADQTALLSSLLGAELAEDLFVLSIDGEWSVRQNALDDGPVSVGFCHNDYDVAEIAENLTIEISDPGNKIAQERSRRLIRKAGTFSMATVGQSLANGRPIRTKMKFLIDNGHGPGMWAFNHSGSGLTTGGVIHCWGTIYGRWIR